MCAEVSIFTPSYWGIIVVFVYDGFSSEIPTTVTPIDQNILSLLLLLVKSFLSLFYPEMGTQNRFEIWDFSIESGETLAFTPRVLLSFTKGA
jgi:hypothetical protein